MTNQEWIQTMNTKDLAVFLNCVRNSEIVPTSFYIWLKAKHIDDENTK